jgi:hypothetical protein
MEKRKKERAFLKAYSLLQKLPALHCKLENWIEDQRVAQKFWKFGFEKLFFVLLGKNRKSINFISLKYSIGTGNSFLQTINPPLPQKNKQKGASLYTKAEKFLQLTLALKRQLQTTTFLMFFKAHRGAFLTNLSKTMNQRELEKFLNNYSMTLNYYLPIIFFACLEGRGF